jgi:nucleotide-binding universal stress UspA family protein
MTTTMQDHHADIAASAAGAPRVQHSIIVGTTGDEPVPATLALAAEIAKARGAELVLASAIEPPALPSPELGLAIVPPFLLDEIRTARARQIQHQAKRAGLAEGGYRTELLDGDPATTLAGATKGSRADLVIVGRSHHDLLDRVLGSETALRTLRRSHAPVLVVPPSLHHLPRSAVIATDFSVASLNAAHSALALFPGLKKLFVVHVSPPLDQQPEPFATWTSALADAVCPALKRFVVALELPPTVSVEIVPRQGRPAREIVEAADVSMVDLIVMGSKTVRFLDRLLVGSTASGVIRGSTCAVLAVPARSGITSTAVPAEIEAVEERQWASLLSKFSQRNAGRRASLEVDDPEIGAQSQEENYPFLGASYDHHDKRVSIMMGDLVAGGRHLTRGISEVHQVDLLKHQDGRDLILRIGHGEGQTLLTLKWN